MSVDLHGLLHALGERERAVLAHILRRTPTVRDSNAAFDARLTFGERLADRVASFGGSWTFILKAEMEVMALHLKLDELREQQWAALMAVQAEQMRLLERLSGGRATSDPSAG